jgi:hypothetical protein
MSQSANQWYIVQGEDGHCDIVPAAQLETQASSDTTDTLKRETWGPFDSPGDAIARRVGLIRAGKCKPV